MASSRILSYKSTNRIDPKLKRRLRRSGESSAKREEEINKRRNLLLLRPGKNLNIDLSAETKAKEKNTKSSQAHCERLNMLRKWKEERELLKKEEALKRGKNKPFIVSVTSHAASDIKTNFERKWEQEQKKGSYHSDSVSGRKTAKKPVAVSAATRQRAGTTSAKSTLTTTATSQRTTRQTANKQTKPSAAVSSTRAVTTRAAPATQASKPLAPTSMRAISTRAISSKTMNSQPVPPKKAPPKTTRTEPVRRSTRHSVKTLPDVPSVKTKRGQKQEKEVEQPVIFETHLEDEKEEELVVEPKVENLDISTKKMVSFAPASDLQSLEISPFSLSPASVHSFFYEDPRSSSSPETNNFVTTRAEISGSPVVIQTFVETDRSVRLSPTITLIDMVENGEDLNIDSAKTIPPEKEPPQQEEAKSPCSPASPLVTAKSFQRSFLPAIPSPLLQDITPHKKKRASRKSFLFTDAGSQKRTEVTPRQNSEMETDQEPTEKVLVLQTPPRRCRGHLRKPVISPTAVNKTPSLDDMMQRFIKNLSCDSLNGSQPSENLIINSLVETSKELPDLTPLKNEKPTPRQTRRRKTVGSQHSENLIINSPVETSKELPGLTPLKNGKPTPRQTRRRKTVDSQASNPSPNRRCSTRISRQSVSISEEEQTTSLKENVSLLHPIVLHETSEIKSKRGTRKTKCVAFLDEVSTMENTDSPLTVLSPVSLNVDAMEERKELNKNGQFKKLKVNYTPVRGLKSSPTTVHHPRPCHFIIHQF